MKTDKSGAQKMYIVYHESAVQSILSDVFTFGCLFTFFYVTRDASVWNMFAAMLLFIVFLSRRSSNVAIIHGAEELHRLAETEQLKKGSEI